MLNNRTKPTLLGRLRLILECVAVVQEGNIRKTMAARGLIPYLLNAAMSSSLV